MIHFERSNKLAVINDLAEQATKRNGEWNLQFSQLFSN